MEPSSNVQSFTFVGGDSPSMGWVVWAEIHCASVLEVIHGCKAMLPEIVLEKILSSLLPASGDTRSTLVPAVLVLNLSVQVFFSSGFCKDISELGETQIIQNKSCPRFIFLL